MSWSVFLPQLAVMAIVTYLIRMLPLALFRKKISSRFVRSFLYYGPYAVFSAMTLPSILPTIVTMFLLGCGNIMRIGPDKALLLYNSMTYEVADIFSTYVYRIGLVKKNFSFATAVGLFESVIAVIVLLAANTASRRITGESLW